MHQHGGNYFDYPNAIDFSANINFNGIPDGVKLAIKNAVEDCDKYPDPQNIKLRKAIAKMEHINYEQVLCGNGAADLIFSLVYGIKPEEVILIEPGFHEYRQAASAMNCIIKSVNLDIKAGFRFTKECKERLLQEIQNEKQMLFICNPNNPTGQLIEKKELLDIADRCEKVGAILVIDECFLPFIEAEKEYSLLDELNQFRNLLILRAFTKFYALPGIRLGYLCSNNQNLLLRLCQYRQPWSVSYLAQQAGIAACKETKYAKNSLCSIRKEKEILCAKMEEMGYQILGSAANFLFFQADDTFLEESKQAGFLIRSCKNFQGLTEEYYRIAVRKPEENQKWIQFLKNRKKQN